MGSRLVPIFSDGWTSLLWSNGSQNLLYKRITWRAFKSSPTPRVSASEGLGGTWQSALSLSFQVMLLLLVWEPRFEDHLQCFLSELHDTWRRHPNTNTWTLHEKFKYHKGTPCSTAVVIRKTWMRHHCILIRMDKIKANKQKIPKHLWPSCTADGNAERCAILKNRLSVSYTFNMSLPREPAIPGLDIYPRETKTYIHVTTCAWLFLTALFIMAPSWKLLKCPSAGE